MYIYINIILSHISVPVYTYNYTGLIICIMLFLVLCNIVHDIKAMEVIGFTFITADLMHTN